MAYPRCKTCKYWHTPDQMSAREICVHRDGNFKIIGSSFEVRVCKQPTQTFAEPPTEPNGFALNDGSTYYAVLATGEDFGCVRHEEQPL